MLSKKLLTIIALSTIVANLGLASVLAADSDQNIFCPSISGYEINHEVHFWNDGNNQGTLTSLTFANRDIKFLDSLGAQTAAKVIELFESISPLVPITSFETNKISIVSNVLNPNDLTGTGCPLRLPTTTFTVTLSSTGLTTAGSANIIPVLFKDAAQSVCPTTCDLSTPVDYTVPGISFVENAPQDILYLPITPNLSETDGFTTNYTNGVNVPLKSGSYTGTLNFSITPVILP